MASNLVSVEQIKEKIIPILRKYPVDKAIYLDHLRKEKLITPVILSYTLIQMGN